MGDIAEFKMLPTGEKTVDRPIFFQIVDTPTLKRLQSQVLTASGSEHSKPGQQVNYFALELQGSDKLLPTKSDITYSTLAGLKELGEIALIPKRILQDAKDAVTIGKHGPKPLTPLDIKHAKAAPVRTAIVLGTESVIKAGAPGREVSTNNYKQLHTFIGDVQGDLLVIDTVQDASGMARMDKRALLPVPLSELNEAQRSPEARTNLVKKLQEWEHKISSVQLSIPEGPGYYVPGPYSTGGMSTNPQNSQKR